MRRSERGGGIEALVDVEVEIEAALGGEREEAVEHARRGPAPSQVTQPEHAAAARRPGRRAPRRPAPPMSLERDQRAPPAARSGRPIRRAARRTAARRSASCGGTAVEMGADRDRAVGEGAAQPELEARAHVGRASSGAIAVGARPPRARPRRCRPGSRRAARCGPCRGGCGSRPGPARPARRPGGGRRLPGIAPDPAATDRRDATVGDLDVDQRQPLAGVGEVLVQQAERHPGVGDPQARHGAPAQPARWSMAGCAAAEAARLARLRAAADGAMR